MSDPFDRIETSDARVGPHVQAPRESPPTQDSLQLDQYLLQQSIDQLERLRQDYRQIRTLLAQLWQQLTDREVQVSQHLRDAVALLARSADCAADDPPRDMGTQPLVLQVRALGRFAVYYQNHELPLGSSRKGRALLRYLLTRSERRAARDVLLDLFWPDEDPERARHKLHICISKLRQTLRDGISADLDPMQSIELQTLEGCILFEDDAYRLHPAIGVDLDADAFAARFRAGRHLERENRLQEAVQEYRAAMDLYRGDLLTEDLYADWAAAPRARLEEMYLTLLSCLSKDYLENGRYMESIACCRQILARDSFREDAYRQLMRCYSRMGQRNRALTEFDECTRVLRRELGVLPAQETIDLHDRIVCEQEV